MISTTNEKKKRVSKKRKSAWRKHVDIKDVNQFLEEQRLEERLGEPLSTIKDDQLFKVDTDPKEQALSAKEKKRLRLAAPPKCFSMLQPHTKVPDPISKRNRVRTKQERMSSILKRKETERKTKGILKPRQVQSLGDRRKCQEEKAKEKGEDKFSKDIWTTTDKLEDDEWIDRLTKRHTLRGTGKLNKIIPKLAADKSTFIPNVEIPHPGTSYNPSLEDHNNLLAEIAGKEVKVIKEEEHLKRVTKDMFRLIPRVENANAWLVEMSQGLPEKNLSNNIEESDEDSGDDEKPYKSVNAPVENKKKTEKQRRKQREQLLLKEKLLQAKLEKKKTVELHKLKGIKAQIENRDIKLKKQRERREKMKMYKQREPKQLGRLKYEEPDVDFNMPEDLVGNLRNLKAEGSLLTDRFRSLQKRNILPVTARQNRKKTKVKKFTKAGFKDEDWKKTVANKNIFPGK